jgi:SAM-dependent methyltransferase
MELKKLHIGCGNIIKAGYVNADLAPLAGVDVVMDLTHFPWPFEDGAFELIEMHNVLEHLPDVFRTMEELYRIAAPNAEVLITVPYYNSIDFGGDPTHLHGFTQYSMDFLDERTSAGKERPYYSKARFHVQSMDYYNTLALGKWIKVSNRLGRTLLGAFAYFLSNIIRAMTFHLRAIK